MESKAREISDSANKPLTHNAIINGNFDIWQRNISIPLGTGERYVADRWIASALNATTSSANRQPFAAGQTEVPFNPKYYHSQTVVSGAGASDRSVMVQRLEDVTTFSGEKVTLTFWAKADGVKNIASEFAQVFGTGGAPSPDVVSIGVETHELTSSWQKFTSTVNINPIVGTVGTNNDDYLQLAFWFDAGSDNDARTNSLGNQSGTFDIAQVQLERGSISTDFEIRPLAHEITLCQRYYEKTYHLDQIPGTTSVGSHVNLRATAIGNNWGGTVKTETFNVEKRVPPTFTVYAPHTGTPGFVSAVISAGTPFITGAFLQGSTRKAWRVWNNTNAIGDGDYIFYEWTADAEL